MKKFLFIVLLLFVPFAVKALDCVSVTGTGEELGDEVKCGTESFYVLSRDSEKTQLLAKYNLFVGDKIDYIEADNTAPAFENYQQFDTASKEYCDSYGAAKGYNAYYTYPMVNQDGTSVVGCRIYERINYEHVLQDPRAVGTVLINGKSKLPLYGITYMEPRWGYEAIHDGIVKNNVYDANGNLILEGSSFKGYIDGYKAELQRQNIPVKDVSFAHLSKILGFLKEVSGRDVNLNLQGTDDAINEEDYYIGKMDVKEFIHEKYKWLYSTTYWMGSGFEVDEHGNNVTDGGQSPSASQYNDYYLSNEGFLCALGRGECGYFAYPIGNGVRPVITVSNVNVLNSSEDFSTDEEQKPNPNTATGYIVMSSAILVVALITCLLYYKKAKKAHR